MVAAELLDRLPRACLEGAAFIALVAVVCRLAPRLGARYRAALWWLASAKLLLALVPLAPVAVALLPPVATASSSATAPIAPVETVVRSAGSVPEPIAVARMDAQAALAIAWAAGVAILFAASLPATLRARAWRRSGRPVDDPKLVAAIEKAARAVGLRRVPDVRLVTDLPGPLVIGLIRPAVLLPHDAPARLSAAEMDMALEHEMAHLARRDLWLGLVPAAARRILFFHPLAWLAEREYAIAREAACDEAVVGRNGADVFAYGRLLLRLAVARPAATATLSPRSVLRRRLEMIETTVRRSPLHARAGWAVVAVAIVALIPVQLVAREAPEPPTPPPAAAAPATPEAPVAPEAEAVAEAGVAPGTPAPPPPRVAPAVAPRAGTPAPTARQTPPPPAPPARVAAPMPPPRSTGTPMAAPPPPAPDVPDAETPAPRARRAPGFARMFDGCLPLGEPARSSYVILHGDSRTMCGEMSDVHEAQRVRRGDEDLVWFRVDGQAYVVRDQALVAEALAMFEAQRRLGNQQAELGERQAEIGERQADIGDRQVRVGEAQARLHEQLARAERDGNADIAKISTELSRQMQVLARDMERTAREQEELSAAQAELASRMTARTASGQRAFSRMLSEAMQSGAAEQVH